MCQIDIRKFSDQLPDTVPLFEQNQKETENIYIAITQALNTTCSSSVKKATRCECKNK